jgi:hypothetical protein
LKLHKFIMFEQDILARKPCLQRLELVDCWVPGGPDGPPTAASVGQLLSTVQDLQQLTHMQFSDRAYGKYASSPAAAFAVLTASSKLRHLDISGRTLPRGVWQHMFLDGRQLPHLQGLDISCVLDPEHQPIMAPNITRFLSCCPRLQSINMVGLEYSRELLAPLTGLSSLTELHLCPYSKYSEGFDVVHQLIGLRRLHLIDDSESEGLLQLTRLKQLTYLAYGDDRCTHTFCQVSQHVAHSHAWAIQ